MVKRKDASLALTIIDECLAHLREYPIPNVLLGADLISDSRSDLWQLVDAMHLPALVMPEPLVRTVHHFACTGGTLIGKCIAACPNVHLLSEIEPHSPMRPAHQFYPTDLISLIQTSGRPVEAEVVTELFLNGIETIDEYCRDRGLRLVLRSHAHSRYCLPEFRETFPDARSLLKTRFDVRSIVTVRHPLDSYLSARSLNWLSGPAIKVDEYCRRYLCFLDDHVDIEIYKYEELVEHPEQVMRKICNSLALVETLGYESLLDQFTFSGDSGRSSGKFELRERRSISPSIAQELEASEKYYELVERLCYDPDWETE